MGQTSIPVDSEVRDRLAADKPADASWSEYLSVLHSEQEIVVDGGGGTADEVTLEATEYKKIAEEVAGALR